MYVNAARRPSGRERGGYRSATTSTTTPRPRERATDGVTFHSRVARARVCVDRCLGSREGVICNGPVMDYDVYRNRGGE